MAKVFGASTFSTSPSNEYSGLISFRINLSDLLAVQGTLKSLLQHHSLKASILWWSAFFTVQLSHPYMTTGKTIALTRWTFVGKVVSLLFNMLSRLIIDFLPRSKCLLLSWLQSPSAVILEPPKNRVSHSFPLFPPNIILLNLFPKFHREEPTQSHSKRSCPRYHNYMSVSHLVVSNSLQPHGLQQRQASLSITNFRSLPKLMSIESVIPSNHLILCHPLLLLPSIFPSIRIFSNESTLRMRWPKYWSFGLIISPSSEYPGLVSFRMDWLDLLAVQGTLKSLLQHHSSKASILWCSAFFIVQLSHPYMTTGKTIDGPLLAK